MKKAKKIFKRMCLNNWGGITHQILEFHEYVNLFSGMSGSGKSTVMDAIQVILYGSISSNFLNKAADDARNKRSVLSYLRGEQKDGTANRAGKDFCSVIALEIEDTGSHMASCVGLAFEIRKNDTEIRKMIYFSHTGNMPEQGYLTQAGYPYTNQEIRKLVEERAAGTQNRGRSDVNRIYPSKEAYTNALYDNLLGYIDGKRFHVMEKSAIALKMTDGTGQFIKDYMFPKNDGDIIGKISEQLGAYRDIQEKIKDMRQRIALLTQVQQAGQRKTAVSADILRSRAMIQCVEVIELQNKIAVNTEEIQNAAQELVRLEDAAKRMEVEMADIDGELIQVSAELKASDVGIKQDQLKELIKLQQMYAADSEQWHKITKGLVKWEQDEIVTDYITNPMLNRIAAFCKGKVDEDLCQNLRKNIQDAKTSIDEVLEEYNEQRRDLEKEIRELTRLVDDMQNDRKPYPPVLKEARAALERRLTDSYGRVIKVNIFADLFNVEDAAWKNAIEGRLGRLKYSLVTEPKYAQDAARIFREMKKYEEVELINTDAVLKQKLFVEENSLYEAVKTDISYMDACLKRYLGRIQKCYTIEELEHVRDGVTPDCYSYSNFIFRHLRKADYEKHACIGTKVSKAKLETYCEKLQERKKEYAKVKQVVDQLKAAAGFEDLNNDTTYFIRLSKAGKELDKVTGEITALRQEIARIIEGEFKELQERKDRLTEKKENKRIEQSQNQNRINEYTRKKSHREGELKTLALDLEEKNAVYKTDIQIEEEVRRQLETRSSQTVRSKLSTQINSLEEKEQEEIETLQNARNRFNREYPSVGFSGAEKENTVYERLLQDYQSDYEPKYENEFEKQCSLIYKSLRENVIATIHGDINAAKRHTHEINRLLRETNFADSTYQIKIEPARDEKGQFYEMLTAPELDSKNIGTDMTEGQISLGEDTFYQKYEQKIKLLTDKFMPLREEDGRIREQRIRDMEEYADYRNYLSFSMYEQVTDENGTVVRENYVDEMAGRDSGGEGQNPKYVALLAGFAMLYNTQSSRDSKIKLVLLDEAFSKMDQERSAVCLKYARKMDLQLIVCVPDERLQSLIRNVDCVYGFRRFQNQISMMHIDKGNYLELLEGEKTYGTNDSI
ncbi:chromosome partition protein Smc [Lachnospiraceae bacterium]|nr:chromosome partition protein Smc [Lachnospiraceae bacterium]